MACTRILIITSISADHYEHGRSLGHTSDHYFLGSSNESNDAVDLRHSQKNARIETTPHYRRLLCITCLKAITLLTHTPSHTDEVRVKRG